jgi:guanylate kinase
MMSVPQLSSRQDFEEVLADYHMNIEAQKTLNSTPLVLLVAATSTGRNTIIEELVNTSRYYFIVSDTTRPPRMNDGQLEQNGVEYFFRDEASMLQELKKGKFVEAAIIHGQQVSGVSIREIASAQEQGKIAITDIEPVGTDHIMQLKPDTMAIFVLPPSFEEWLNRIQKRTPVTKEELVRRLRSAVKEFKAAQEKAYYLFVINDDLEHAIEQVDDIARFNKVNAATQTQARELLKQLTQQTEAYLATHS